MNHINEIESSAPAQATSQTTMAQGGNVAQTAVQNAPYTQPAITQNTASMAEGGEASSETSNSNDTKNEWGQWIAIGLISLTLVSLIMQIAVHKKSMQKMDTDEGEISKDIKELKMNLKRQMGEKYEELG